MSIREIAGEGKREKVRERRRNRKMGVGGEGE